MTLKRSLFGARKAGSLKIELDRPEVRRIGGRRLTACHSASTGDKIVWQHSRLQTQLDNVIAVGQLKEIGTLAASDTSGPGLASGITL